MMKRHHPAYPVLLTLLLTTALVGCQRDPLPERNDVIRFAVGPVAVASTTSKAEELPDINPPTTVFQGLEQLPYEPGRHNRQDRRLHPRDFYLHPDRVESALLEAVRRREEMGGKRLLPFPRRLPGR